MALLIKGNREINNLAILLTTAIAIMAFLLAFSGNNSVEVTAGSPYAAPLEQKQIERLQETIKTVKEVGEAVVVIVQAGEKAPEDVKKAILEAPIQDLLEGAPVTPDTSAFDKNDDGVVDVVDMVEIYAEKGLMAKPPKISKAFAENLLETLKKIYGPNLENFPSPEGKLWLLALYKLAE